MGSNHKIDFKYLLDQMLSGKLNSDEKENLQNYINTSFKDPELDLLMHEHWLGLENEKAATDEIQLLILKNQIISRISQSQNPISKEKWLSPTNWKTYLMRVAAALFVPLLLGSAFVFYLMNKQLDQKYGTTAMQQVIATPGSRVHFTLPDQTEVWLNSGSTLEFQTNFNLMEQRIVKLSGQGYFKVAHDKEHPFLVETEGMWVKALGTEFDVSSYGDNSFISSTLEEGSVAILDMCGDEMGRIHPGQEATLDKVTNVLKVNDVDTELTTSWKDGKLIFRNTSLEDVTMQLERWFNCEIHVDPNLSKLKLLYNATIQNETLGEVLKMIEISTSVETKIEKREVYIGHKK